MSARILGLPPHPSDPGSEDELLGRERHDVAVAYADGPSCDAVSLQNRLMPVKTGCFLQSMLLWQ